MSTPPLKLNKFSNYSLLDMLALLGDIMVWTKSIIWIQKHPKCSGVARGGVQSHCTYFLLLLFLFIRNIPCVKKYKTIWHPRPKSDVSPAFHTSLTLLSYSSTKHFGYEFICMSGVAELYSWIAGIDDGPVSRFLFRKGLSYVSATLVLILWAESLVLREDTFNYFTSRSQSHYKSS